MSAPAGVELNEDVLLVLLEDDIFKSISDDVVDGFILSLGDRLALDAGWDLALCESSDKVTDVLGVDCLALWHGELGGFLNLLDGEGGPLGFGQVEGLGVVGEL